MRPRILVVTALLALPGCDPAPAPSSSPDRHRLTQVSVINALMVGRFDGVMPIPDLLRLGDFGVGTLDHLDGELIILDGKAYQIRGDGAVVEVAPGRSTPFAVVTQFASDREIPCPRVASLADLDARLDDTLPQKNNFVAVRIDGHFHSLTLRSVGRQEPPYKPLAEVARSQSVRTHADVSGTLVGIRCPPWAGGLNVPGYHWHFLSDDRKIGGHVLDCSASQGRVRFQVCQDWLVKLDGSAGFNAAELNQDLRRELQNVESSRGNAEKPDR